MTWADFHSEIVEAMANMEPWPCEIIPTGCGPCGQPSLVMGPNEELVVEGFRKTEIEACMAGQPPPRGDLTGYVYHSTNGGLNWAKLCDVPLHFRVPDECDTTYGPQLQGMGFLRDGTLLSIIRNYYGKGQMSVDNETFHSRVWITRSTDRGETWNEPVELDPAPYELIGGNKVRFHQMRDGTVLMPMSCTRWSRPGKPLDDDERVLCTQMFASSDNGKTWSTIGNLGKHSDESDLLELPSGRILASTRSQRLKMPDDPPELERPGGERGGSVYKQTAVFYSDDGGRTFSDHRLLTGWLQGRGAGAAVHDQLRRGRDLGQDRFRTEQMRHVRQFRCPRRRYHRHGVCRGMAFQRPERARGPALAGAAPGGRRKEWRLQTSTRCDWLNRGE